MFAAAVAVYASCTRAKNKIGAYGFWPFIVLLLALYISALLGPAAAIERVRALRGLTPA